MVIKCFVCGDYMNNCYVVNNEESKDCFIVDPGYPNSALEKYLISTDLKPLYIILTHGHGDHTGGIERLKEIYPDIKLIAGKKESKLLYNRDTSFGKGGIIADINVSDNDVMSVCGIELKFIETPGHTPGGISIYAKEAAVLFSGDTLFRCSIGRTDFPGGSYNEIINSITEKLFKLPDETRVLCGHDAETTIGIEKRYNPFVS